jgi:hypothetical protein
MSQIEPGLQPRSGVYAWDERDSCSIASHTPSYGGLLPAQRRAAEAVPAAVASGPSVPSRFASALLALIRPRPRLEAARG